MQSGHSEVCEIVTDLFLLATKNIKALNYIFKKASSLQNSEGKNTSNSGRKKNVMETQ